MFQPIQTTFTTDLYNRVTEYTLTITYESGSFMLRLDPEFTSKGTHEFNGYFPRSFKSVPAAKGSATRFVGEKTEWIPVSEANKGNE